MLQEEMGHHCRGEGGGGATVTESSELILGWGVVQTYEPQWLLIGVVGPSAGQESKY